MQIQISMPDGEIIAQVHQLRHGFRLDARARVGDSFQFFRIRAANVRTAAGQLRIEIINARQAYALRYLRKTRGLRLVVNNEPSAA